MIEYITEYRKEYNTGYRIEHNTEYRIECVQDRRQLDQSTV